MPLSFLDDDQTLRDMLTSRRVLKGIAGRKNQEMSHDVAPQGSFYGEGILGDLQRDMIDPYGHKGIRTPQPELRQRQYGIQDPRFRGGYDAEASFSPLGALATQAAKAAGVDLPGMKARVGDFLAPVAAIESAVTAGQNLREGDVAGGIGHTVMAGVDAAATSLGTGAMARGAGFAPSRGIASDLAPALILGNAPLDTSTFIGVGAKNFPHDKLKIAEKMEAGGAGRDEIFQQTQLWRGADKKWRSEIDDYGAGYTPYKLDQKFDYGKTWGKGKLEDLIEHPDVYNEYSGLGDMEVIDYPWSGKGGLKGQYSPEGQFMDENISLFKGGGKSTGLHETQHAIQGREGFAGGGPSGATAWLSSELRPHLTKEYGRIIDDAMQPLTLENYRMSAWDGAPLNDEIRKNYKAYLKSKRDSVEKYAQDFQLQAARNVYKRLGGEVEARNVQKRLDWPMWQRQMIPPWMTEDVPLQDQIVRMGSGGVSHAIKPLKGKGAVDLSKLPDSITDIANSGRWDVAQTSPVESGRRVDFEVPPENTEGLTEYMGREFTETGQARGKAWVDPRYADIAETSDDGMVWRSPKLRDDSGLSRNIPATRKEGVLYRGVSKEEYDNILNNGKIESKGLFNLGDEQAGTTSYSIDPEQAESYASGFAPTQHTPSPGKNAYVIAVKDPGTALDIPGLRGSNERSIPGAISADDILEVYEGVPYAVNQGKFDMPVNYSGDYEGMGSGVMPTSYVGWRKLKRNSKKIGRIDDAPKIDYPIADRGEWWGDANYDSSGGTMADMSPDDFLKLDKPIDPMEEITGENIQDLMDHVEAGGTLDPPVIYADGSIDGRHRMWMSKNLGIGKVPVIDYRKK